MSKIRNVRELRERMGITAKRTSRDEGRISISRNRRNKKNPFNILVRMPGEKKTQFVTGAPTMAAAEKLADEARNLLGIRN